MDEVGGGIWNCIREGNLDDLTTRVDRVIKTKINQEIQLDWSKIDRSKFCAGRIRKRILKWRHIGKTNNWKGQLKICGRD